MRIYSRGPAVAPLPLCRRWRMAVVPLPLCRRWRPLALIPSPAAARLHCSDGALTTMGRTPCKWHSPTSPFYRRHIGSSTWMGVYEGPSSGAACHARAAPRLRACDGFGPTSAVDLSLTRPPPPCHGALNLHHARRRLATLSRPHHLASRGRHISGCAATSTSDCGGTSARCAATSSSSGHARRSGV